MVAATPVSVPGADLALYVHWPFCRAKCPYCDFNSHVRTEVDQQRWRGALVRELDHWAETLGPRQLTSIFIGGGTPSLMPAATAATAIERAAFHWSPAADLEVTLEANPTSVEAAGLRDFRRAGINRVSLGVQALDDASLRTLGREHSFAEALDAVDLAARLFPRHSFDLIYGRPEQTVAAWEAELTRALHHTGGHLSAYQLTIEPGTRFHTLHRDGRLVLPDDDVQADLYELTRDVLAAAGLPAYEISNHAAPGHECRHNLAYWRAGDWIGIGPGAHGRLGRGAERREVVNRRLPERWLEAVGRMGHGIEREVPVLPADALHEVLMMGLRLVEGVPAERIEAAAGAPLECSLDMTALSRLVDGGFIERDKERLRATDAGRQRLNAVLATLLA